jgi:hypothetical protein
VCMDTKNHTRTKWGRCSIYGAKYGRVYPYIIMGIPIICSLTSMHKILCIRIGGLPQVMRLRVITTTGIYEGRVIRVRVKSKDSFQNT